MLSKRERIFSLDFLRGLAIFIMIFVDAPPAKTYSWQAHAMWEGLTLADMAFPGFVFAMGMSAAVATFQKEIDMKKIFWRSAILFLIGIFFNAKWHFFTYLFQENFTGTDFFDKAIEHGRFFGILQRLALTYLFGMLLAKFFKNEPKIIFVSLGILIISSLGFHFYSPSAPFLIENNISGTVDKIFPGVNHIYTPNYDPEGLYGTFASTSQFLLGFLSGKILAKNLSLQEKTILFFSSGIIFLILGGLWNFFDIMAKNIWTAPFALITSGIYIILLAVFLQLFEKFPKIKNFSRPIISLGKNPLFFFLSSNIIVAIFCNILVDDTPMWVWFWQKSFEGLVSPEFSVMIFCLIWTLIWLPIAIFFDKQGIIIKI